PKDVKALIITTHENGYEPKLIKAVDQVNTLQKKVLAEKIKDYFSSQNGLKDKILALWGLSFKANTDDIRESAALEIISQLTAEGMHIRAFDPVAGENAKKNLQDNPLAQVIDNQYHTLEGADALAVATDWNQFRNPDFNRIKKTLTAPVIFDGRNLYSPSFVAEQGFAYFSIGRRPISN
ncbi:MAG: UDP-glucose/GDP-mannose dehydrogenase family protein, partial [Desulfobacterales bacterium]|nr:UDP-glucose 6-dehydrogenase [Deltaproteobacteria bacterium]NNL43665.1 UDP-glucose/GDP-mannose dehydrogenase family protein [Desulfobacterales bacterium]